MARRAHRATGKPRGGARSGAGRKEGSNNVLPLGTIRALVATQCAQGRAADASGEKAEALEQVMGRVADVLFCKVDYRQSNAVLKAAAMAADAIAGKQAERHEVKQEVTLAQLLEESYRIEEREKAAVPSPADPAPPVAVAPVVRRRRADSEGGQSDVDGNGEGVE